MTYDEFAGPPYQSSRRLFAVGIWGYLAVAIALVVTALSIMAFAPLSRPLSKNAHFVLGAIGLTALLVVGAGILAGFASWVAVPLALLTRRAVKSVAPPPSGQVPPDLYRDAERIRIEQQRAAEDAFQRNLKDTFVLQEFRLRGVRFFDDCVYRFKPRVNILLGKNGYGKTLLLRTLAAMIQDDLERGNQVFDRSEAALDATPPEGGPLLRLEVTRNNHTEETTRDALYFTRSMGKIPLLAIPDSRFVDRTRHLFGAPAAGSESLVRHGARNFLSGEAYVDVIHTLFYQLGLDYSESRRFRARGFDHPIFPLLQDVVRTLTEDAGFRFVRIERSGPAGFEILVATTGSEGMLLPIQAASQGTLSVLAIFGLIYGFLRELRPDAADDEVVHTPAIVFIDEIDAHLHPSWQQKVVGLLTSRFPKVQFLIAAHSPLIVAGCDWGEVAVLRRPDPTSRFAIELLEQDFIGTTTRELYDLIFEIDDEMDRLYLEYATKATTGQKADLERDIQRLGAKSKRSPEEEEELERLRKEARLVDRASQVRTERLQDDRTRIAELEREVDVLKKQLKEARGAEGGGWPPTPRS